MDKIFNNTIERLLYFTETKGLSIRQFSKSVGISHSLLKKTTALGSDKLENILSIYPEINPEWLLTGKGNMLKVETDDISRQVVQESNGLKTLHTIPLVDLSAIRGFGRNNFSIEKSDIKEYYVVPRFKMSHIDFLIEASGASMYPRYASGDLLACTIIRASKFIQWGRVYVADTHEQGIFARRLYPPGSKNEDYYECRSDNQEYPPFEIHRKEITGIAIVVGVISME